MHREKPGRRRANSVRIRNTQGKSITTEAQRSQRQHGNLAPHRPAAWKISPTCGGPVWCEIRLYLC